jgi:hypothetical protein
MEAIQNEAQAAQAHEAHTKAQTAQAHALLHQQHAQASQRTALAVQHQHQAAEALTRFGVVATSMAAHQAPISMSAPSPEKAASASLHPYQAPPSPLQVPPSFNRHALAAGAARIQKETERRQQQLAADNITSIDSTQQQSSPMLPPIQPQLSARQQIELRRRNDAAVAAEIFSNDVDAITITVPTTQQKNAVLDAAACENEFIRKSTPYQPPPVAATNDDAGIFDDAEEDEDFTAQFR